VEEFSGILAGSKVKAIRPRQPTVFAFQGLKPETGYSVQIRGCHTKIPSSFKTTGQRPNEMKFAVISCNKVFITQTEVKSATGDLWHHLSKRIAKGQVDMMLHLGDQVVYSHRSICEPWIRDYSHSVYYRSAFFVDARVFSRSGGATGPISELQKPVRRSELLMEALAGLSDKLMNRFSHDSAR
jgi:hypothetical protein